MKQKRSINEALDAAKAMRKQVTTTQPTLESTEISDSHLKIINPSATLPDTTSSTQASPPTTQVNAQQKAITPNPKPLWVRHTIGLRDTTSLDLRDAADAQKRKERRGQLQLGEPANEQEIADLGIRLALEHLGFLSESQ